MSEFQYVSSVKGHLVTRFPSLRSPVAQYIGATRKGKEIVWDETVVVAIPAKEWQQYRREYRRAIADGALKSRTAEDFEKYREAKGKADSELEAKLKAEAAKAEAPTSETTSSASEDSTRKASTSQTVKKAR